MMPTLIKDLRNELHNKACMIRSIDRIVNSVEFATAYEIAKLDDRVMVATMIRSGNKDGIEFWLRKERENDDGARPIRELRVIAQQLGIRFYNRLPKALLLSEISKCRVILMSSANCVKSTAS